MGILLDLEKIERMYTLGKKKSWVPNELIQQMSTIKMPCKMKWALTMYLYHIYLFIYMLFLSLYQSQVSDL